MVQAVHMWLAKTLALAPSDLNHHLPRPAQAKGKNVGLTVHDDRSLLAVQGPSAVKAVQAMTKEDLSKFYFSNFMRMELQGIPVWITRTG